MRQTMLTKINPNQKKEELWIISVWKLALVGCWGRSFFYLFIFHQN